MGVLDVDRDYSMLSLRELIAARDLYHLHLMAKQHVVGTAVGRYLIRKSAPWPQDRQALVAYDTRNAQSTKKEPRTLGNSEMRPYSWPCVIVFVDQWVDEADLAGSGLVASDGVPRTLFMPDGSRVPVCVVYAPLDEVGPPRRPPRNFPKQLMGPGYPVLVDVQGEEHFASVGCLVTDGHRVYALTSRHVTGAAGERVYALIGGSKVPIGVSAEKQLTRKPFQQIYPEWPGKNVFVNLDVGLIDVDDKHDWTAQVYGLGQLGALADVSVDNISLRLIDCPVRAYGAVSGPLAGRIKGLFYRYKSVGGFEHVADLLIGPRDETPLPTEPGDSGTLWVLETGDPVGGPRPLALQWGGHRFITGSSTAVTPYALATFLSTVCLQLEVDVVRDWNLGVVDYWGAVGHYTIATKACERVKTPRLRALMNANLSRISFAAQQINKKTTTGLSKHDFVPLADVPDLVWKIGPYNRGQPEHPNHFADMDKQNSAHKTLLELCEAAPDKVTVEMWQEYYTDVGDESRGLLPFRAWQIYDEMVRCVRDDKLEQFVCAAGILSHYVGDACQPLHISYMFNGDPADSERVEQRNRRTGKLEEVDQPRAAGVHSAYEDRMVNYHIAEIIEGLDQDDQGSMKRVKGGRAAALAVIALMQQTFETIEPKAIVDEYMKHKDAEEKPKPIADALWEKFGKKTISVMSDGCQCLAMLWESAWSEGGGEKAADGTEAAFDEETLAGIYQDKRFLVSRTLDQIGDVLRSG
jgi:hypothetical protein